MTERRRAEGGGEHQDVDVETQLLEDMKSVDRRVPAGEDEPGDDTSVSERRRTVVRVR
jgi:hypothetical protein